MKTKKQLFNLFAALMIAALAHAVSAGSSTASDTSSETSSDISSDISSETSSETSDMGTMSLNTLRLGLEETMEAALENNLDLKVSRMTPQKARESIKAAASMFDPVVTIEGSSADQESWNESIGSSYLQFSAEAAVSKLMPTGTALSLSLEAADSNAEADNTGDIGGSYVRSTFAVNLPLMKNRGKEVNMRNIVLAENQYRKSEMILKQAVMDTLAQAQTLYWHYYSTLESLTVYEQSLELARRFIKEVEEKVRMGSAARLDILQAKSEVASREAEVIIAQNDVLNAQDNLLNYIYGEAKPGTTVACLADPSISSIIRLSFDESSLINQAITLRTNYQAAGVDLESADTDLVYYKNQTRPELNINAAISINDGHPENELSQSGDYKNYYYGNVGASLKFPWGLQGDKANYAAAKLDKKQLQRNMESIKSRIVLDVRTALRDLNAAVKRYETAQLASQYSSESLDAEQVKFRNGLSTSYNVLLYQRDFTDARVKEVDALIACQTALIELYQAVGNTLEINNITL